MQFAVLFWLVNSELPSCKYMPRIDQGNCLHGQSLMKRLDAVSLHLVLQLLPINDTTLSYSPTYCPSTIPQHAPKIRTHEQRKCESRQVSKGGRRLPFLEPCPLIPPPIFWAKNVLFTVLTVIYELLLARRPTVGKLYRSHGPKISLPTPCSRRRR